MADARQQLEQLRDQARLADELHEQSRQLLVSAVREASNLGLGQREIAQAVGRSQPEISRLLRFHGTSARAMALRKHRRAVIEMAGKAGLTNLRVFGSVARQSDTEASDIDLLADFSPGIGLFDLARLELDMGSLLGARVDIVPAHHLRPNLADQVLKEAIPI